MRQVVRGGATGQEDGLEHAAPRRTPESRQDAALLGCEDSRARRLEGRALPTGIPGAWREPRGVTGVTGHGIRGAGG